MEDLLLTCSGPFMQAGEQAGVPAGISLCDCDLVATQWVTLEVFADTQAPVAGRGQWHTPVLGWSVD